MGGMRGRVPAVGPGSDGFHDFSKVSALWGEDVFDEDRANGVDSPLDNTGLFKLLEALGEEAVAKAGHEPLYLGEPAWTIHQAVEN